MNTFLKSVSYVQKSNFYENIIEIKSDIDMSKATNYKYHYIPYYTLIARARHWPEYEAAIFLKKGITTYNNSEPY